MRKKQPIKLIKKEPIKMVKKEPIFMEDFELENRKLKYLNYEMELGFLH